MRLMGEGGTLDERVMVSVLLALAIWSVLGMWSPLPCWFGWLYPFGVILTAVVFAWLWLTLGDFRGSLWLRRGGGTPRAGASSDSSVPEVDGNEVGRSPS